MIYLTMQLSERQICPLCKGKRFKKITDASFNPLGLQTEHFKITDNDYGNCWTFVRCESCQFVFSNPCINEANIIEFYSMLEDKAYSMEAKGREKNFIKILKTLNKLNPPGKNLLDIGAASGIFLNIAKSFEYQVQGIEPSKPLVDQAEKLYSLNIHCGTLNDYRTESKFQVITLLDIIEHLPEPAPLFKQLASLIQQDGILVIVTPDINSFTAKIMKKKWWHYRIAHVNFFNLPSLKYILEKNGFRIIKKKRFSWNFSLFYLISRLISIRENKKSTLQKILKNINLNIQLFDSWEIYARKD